MTKTQVYAARPNLRGIRQSVEKYDSKAQLRGRKGGSTFLTEMELSFGPTWHIPRTTGKNK